MSDLVEFLLARIAEDEAWANSQRSPACDDCGSDFERVRAECESKRTIVELHQMMAAAAALRRPGTMMAHDTAGNAAVSLPVLSAVLQVLALPYADHPDYQQEWKP